MIDGKGPNAATTSPTIILQTNGANPEATIMTLSTDVMKDVNRSRNGTRVPTNHGINPLTQLVHFHFELLKLPCLLVCALRKLQ